MKLSLITKNKWKVEEISAVLKPFGIEIEQVAEEKLEDKDMSLHDVVIHNTRLFYEKIKKPVIVEDTGIFFDAYPKFPGCHPKLMFNMLGYKGLLKLLEDENRSAHFKSVIGFYDGKELKVFEGRLEGQIDIKINDPDADVMSYERIFLFDGKPISRMTRNLKNKISHRAKAAKLLANFLVKN